MRSYNPRLNPHSPKPCMWRAEATLMGASPKADGAVQQGQSIFGGNIQSALGLLLAKLWRCFPYLEQSSTSKKFSLEATYFVLRG